MISEKGLTAFSIESKAAIGSPILVAKLFSRVIVVSSLFMFIS